MTIKTKIDIRFGLEHISMIWMFLNHSQSMKILKNTVELVYLVFFFPISPPMGLCTRKVWAFLSPIRVTKVSLWWLSRRQHTIF